MQIGRAPWLLAFMLAGCAGVANGPSGGETEPQILSAYFGLDDRPVSQTRGSQLARICHVDGTLDGLPLVFTHEIDQDSVQPEYLRIVTQTGRELTPKCATLAPAQEENEDRTLLLLGELGTAGTDPPVRVDVTGPVMAEATEGETARSLEGLRSPPVTNVADGPFLVFAETVPRDAWEISEPGETAPVNCPAGQTRTLVRLTWSGGVTQFVDTEDAKAPAHGEELGANQYRRIHVDLRRPDGRVVTINPFFVGDRSDGDNNNDLCLAEPGQPLRIRVEAGTVTDPGNDWNGETRLDMR